MERILFVSSGHLLNTKAIDFACHIARATYSGLTGAFLEAEVLEHVPPKNIKASYLLEKGPEKLAELIQDTDQTMRYFEEECRAKGIRSSLFRFYGDPVRETIRESRFADMIILGPEMIAGSLSDEVPVSFTKRLLLESECPVVLAPAVYEGIDEIVFCYDGSASAVFGMKQFSYLFPNYNNKRVIVLEIDEEKSIVEQERIGRWLKNLYSKIGFHALDGSLKDALFRYFFLKKKTFIVMGAYGRSMISELMHHSASDTIMETTDLPLFIAHR